MVKILGMDIMIWEPIDTRKELELNMLDYMIEISEDIELVMTKGTYGYLEVIESMKI